MKRKQRQIAGAVHGRRAGNPATRSSFNGVIVGLVMAALLVVGAGIIFLPRLLESRRSHAGTVGNSIPAMPPGPVAGTPPGASDLPTTNGLAMDDPVQLLNFGTILLGRGRVDEAIEIYLRALKLNGEDEEVHFNLGFAYALQGQKDNAIKHYSEALKIFPEYVEAHNNLGNLLLDQRNYEEAIKHFSASLQIMPENTSALNSFGRALAEQGRTGEAIVHFSEAVRLNPDYLEARCNLGNACLALGKIDEAIAQFSEALRLNPNFPPALKGLGRAREKQAGKRTGP